MTTKDENHKLANARIMALGYALMDAWDQLEENQTIVIKKKRGKASTAWSDVGHQLIAHLINGINKNERIL